MPCDAIKSGYDNANDIGDPTSQQVVGAQVDYTIDIDPNLKSYIFLAVAKFKLVGVVLLVLIKINKYFWFGVYLQSDMTTRNTC